MAPGLACVANVSEGRDRAVIARLAASCGSALLDVHADAWHHRSVFTIASRDPGVVERAARSLATEALGALDLSHHAGAHPRLGVVDVVPFVPLDGGALDAAIAARERFGRWIAAEHGVPAFRYGPERSLPEVRRRAFADLPPDWGPPGPDPRRGATCAGARGCLVAYNVILSGPVDAARLSLARGIASAVRGPAVRALGLAAERVQVSLNLIEPHRVGPAQAFDAVAAEAQRRGARVESAELVGLLPRAVLRAVPERRWASLDLADSKTIEARLAAGFDGGRFGWVDEGPSPPGGEVGRAGV